MGGSSVSFTQVALVLVVFVVAFLLAFYVDQRGLNHPPPDNVIPL
jgi:hypothetical protein